MISYRSLSDFKCDSGSLDNIESMDTLSIPSRDEMKGKYHGIPFRDAKIVPVVLCVLQVPYRTSF